MPLAPATLAFLKYLHRHAAVRQQIRAAPGKTLLYAGWSGYTLGGPRFGFTTPIWREIARLRVRDPQYADKQILNDVLRTVPAPDTGYRSLLQYVQETEDAIARTAPPEAPDYAVLWRTLSGLFAANAEGPVSFSLGFGSGHPSKVFAATEVWVLGRNPKVDGATREILHYLQRCVRNGESDINLGLLRA